MKRILEPWAVVILGSLVFLAFSFAMACFMAFVVMISLALLHQDLSGIPALGFWQCVGLTYIFSFIGTIGYMIVAGRKSNV